MCGGNEESARAPEPRGKERDREEGTATHRIVLASHPILHRLDRRRKIVQIPDVLGRRKDVKIQLEVFGEVLDLVDVVVLVAFVVRVVREEVEEAEEGGFPVELAVFCSASRSRSAFLKSKKGRKAGKRETHSQRSSFPSSSHS